jgi:hypothetical protein
VKSLDIRVIFGFGKDSGNHAPLLGDPEALVGAECFNVDGRVGHGYGR